MMLKAVALLQNLTKFARRPCSRCCREQKIDNYFGRKIAIDASMHIYQFLVGLYPSILRQYLLID